VGVVNVALLVIVQDFVGFLNGLEFDLGSWAFIFGNFIGVAREGGLDMIIVSVVSPSAVANGGHTLR
jgi:hypothetical protein